MRLALVFLLLLSACKLEVDDPLFASGLLLNADGTPLANATVAIEKAKPIEDWMGEPVELEWEPFSTAKTDAAGVFSWDVLWGELLNNHGRLRLRLPSGETGTLSTVFFRPSDGGAEVGPLRAWETTVLLSEDDGVSLTFDPMPATEGLPSAAYFFEIVEGRRLLWRQRVDETHPAHASRYVFRGSAAPQAQVRAFQGVVHDHKRLYGTLEQSPSEIHLLSAPVPLAASTAPAPIEGVTCEAASPCPFADGLPAAHGFGWDPVTYESLAPTEIVLSLDAPRTLVHAVVRNVDLNLSVGWGDRADGAPEPRPLPEALVLEGATADGEWTELARWSVPPSPHRDPSAPPSPYGSHDWRALKLETMHHLEASLTPLPGVTRIRLRPVGEEADGATIGALGEVELFE